MSGQKKQVRSVGPHHEPDRLDQQIATAKRRAARLRKARLEADEWVESPEEGRLRVRIERLEARRRRVRRQRGRGPAQPSGTPGGSARGKSGGRGRKGEKRRKASSHPWAAPSRGLNPSGTRRRATLIG